MAMQGITEAVYTATGISLITEDKIIWALIPDSLLSEAISASMEDTGTFSAEIGTAIIMGTLVGEAATEGIGGNGCRLSY